jgi:hypothetical protein
VCGYIKPIELGVGKGGGGTIFHFGPSVDDQAVSLSDDGTTIIIVMK